MTSETATEIEHGWRDVQFVYGGWIECHCGFRPYSQQDMDMHKERVVFVDPHIQDLRDRENEINDWLGNDPD